ncbi:MAG: hypothetical protein ONB46_00115 [candidate division KSB1 bacterium]|nr:hypothetical protein [candidate division KSB1 bacterium]MDZ7364753.1 hypothetical protein [candidate division KSB1 bacterium]MDZ7402499.1 hypothetical protein [candidate division KSB1 bacterium]
MPDHDENDLNDDEWYPFEEGRPLKAREGALTPVPWLRPLRGGE